MTDAEFVTTWFARVAARFAAEEAALGALDARVGDGDHGATMARAAAAAAAAAATGPDAAARFAAGGRAFADAAGGASGPLVASLWVALAAATRAEGRLSARAVRDGLAGAVDLVRRMGRCAPGDKTLLDALAPAAAAVSVDMALQDALRAAAAAAAAGRDATTAMTARRGRAAWVEGHGVGHPDPGATSLALLLAEAPLALTEPVPAAPKSPTSARVARTAPPGKLLNDPHDAVDEMIDGFTLAHPERVRRLGRAPIVLRATPKPLGRTALVIGNGSGHEPIALGWVGRGLLDANAVGPIFTAPPATTIAAAIAAADRGGGVLLLISHHEGDRIAGELAAELARAEGHRVRTLLMYDDIASAPPDRPADRRGGPGTAFVYKIVGAALEEGCSLERALALGERVRDATRTLSVAVAGGTSPITGEVMFTLPPGAVYLGMGVHGEPGYARMSADSVDAIVARVLTALVEDGGYLPGERLLLFVNGAGGTSLMELLVATRAAITGLRDAGMSVVRPLVGSFVTTQETRGLAISLCRASPEFERLWLAPTDAPFFHL